MKSKQLHDETEGKRNWVLAYKKGDRIVQELMNFAENQNLKSAYFMAIGALKEATLAYFDWEKKEYQDISIDEQVEVLSLIGNISKKGDDYKIHIHVTLGREDGSVRGGHLKEGTVRPTLELFLNEGAKKITKSKDEETGLALMDL
ncbi:MAG TPA: PPC domain-containing DNA-binding protein [Balneolaceae bacterium]|nr:PPC domain-containing DNA-binding protein [Balneolaceae bacterium]